MLRSWTLLFNLFIFSNGQFPGSGGHHGGGFSNQDCFCLPGNQACPPHTALPSTATRVAVTTRIVNTNPNAACPTHQRLCCYPKRSTGEISAPFTVSTGCGSRTEHPLIRGKPGQADFGEYPWMAALVDKSSGHPVYVGGGVLISDNIVLTAAHKIEDLLHFNALEIRLGDYDLSTSPREEIYPHEAVGVRQVIIHPNFRSNGLLNNVAVLLLNRPVNTKHNTNPTIRSACLPTVGQNFEKDRCFVTGWGKNALGQHQSILKEVDLSIVDKLTCQFIYRQQNIPQLKIFQTHNSILCAGGEVGKDACQGDGGSPLVCNENGRWVVAGLVGGGIGCGQDIPGLYTDLSDRTVNTFIKQYARV